MSDVGKNVVKAVEQWRPNFVFGQLPESDKDVYRKLHKHHCEQRSEPDHECKGVISIRHDAITLRCPLCGNVSVEL